jgi:membrane fusion protein (multidrug efflux system)
MKKQISIALCVSLGVIALLGAIKYSQISKAIAEHSSFTPPPEAVTTTMITKKTWQKTLQSVGSLSPVQGVTVSAEEAGKVVKILFESGQMVQKDAVLVELDTAVEEANLKSALARSDKARRVFARYESAKSRNAISEETFDNARADLTQAEADAESIRAVIRKKKIVAPFSGRTGIRMVNVGQFVPIGTPLVPLHNLTQLYADFSLPEKVVSGELAAGNKVELLTDAYQSEIFTGVVAAINPQIDENTRTVTIRALIENPSERLRAGMFVKVKLILPKTEEVIAIPTTGINYAPYGDTVYIAEKMKDPNDPTGKEYVGARQQVVKLGRSIGDLTVVIEGLSEGQEVVTSGWFKLRQGAALNIQNTVQPGSNTSPTPENT